MTLEEAQEKILELTEANQTLTSERDSLVTEKESLTTECENLRTLNQKYFNKLIAQDIDDNNKKDDEPEVPSCEEFALGLEI